MDNLICVYWQHACSFWIPPKPREQKHWNDWNIRSLSFWPVLPRLLMKLSCPRKRPKFITCSLRRLAGLSSVLTTTHTHTRTHARTHAHTRTNTNTVSLFSIFLYFSALLFPQFDVLMSTLHWLIADRSTDWRIDGLADWWIDRLNVVLCRNACVWEGKWVLFLSFIGWMEGGINWHCKLVRGCMVYTEWAM